MNDARRRRSAKQDRRDAKRARKHQTVSDDELLISTIRQIMAGPPPALLALASLVIGSMAPDSLVPPKEKPKTPLSLDTFIASLINLKYRETTAMLAVLAELLVDDDVLAERCRREVSTRRDHLPRWIVGLTDVEVGRVMRRTDVLGDADELMVEVRLTDGTELALVAVIDHNRLSTVRDLELFTGHFEPLADDGESLSSTETFTDMDPADARAWLEHGLRHERLARRSKEWRNDVPMMKWMVSQLPDGGATHQKPDWDDDAIAEVLDEFFASPAGAPFGGDDYRDVLSELCESGCGDPVRWSKFRISDIMRLPFHREHVPLEVAVDAPALLRAFVPFAHDRSGVPQGLTDAAIRTIDEMSRDYRRQVLDDALEYLGDDDMPWSSYPDRAS